MAKLKRNWQHWHFCWLVRVSLFIELGGAEDLGTGCRGAFGTFMISRPIYMDLIGGNLDIGKG